MYYYISIAFSNNDNIQDNSFYVTKNKERSDQVLNYLRFLSDKNPIYKVLASGEIVQFIRIQSPINRFKGVRNDFIYPEGLINASPNESLPTLQAKNELFFDLSDINKIREALGPYVV